MSLIKIKDGKEVELTEAEIERYNAKQERAEVKKLSKAALRKIRELETLPRRVRELGIRLGDQYSIDEEIAITFERNKLTGE